MNYVKLVPRLLREALYFKLVDELQRITESDIAAYRARVLAAARKVLSL